MRRLPVRPTRRLGDDGAGRIGHTAAMTDPVRAQVLLRCAQEVITNSVRHAEARNLWVRLRLEDEGVELRARDDGRGVANFRPGNGLLGMQERLRDLGGTLDVITAAGKGFSLRAWAPLEADTLDRKVDNGDARIAEPRERTG